MEQNSTLLLRFAAPLQAWGSASKFTARHTEREPTKSGVIGFLAAALGRRREESIDDLCTLKFGVRIDQPGELKQDYHTAQPAKTKFPLISTRYYIADAVFLVGVEGEPAFIEQLASAVCTPVFPLFLGRRSCPPAGEVLLGVREATSLADALKSEPWCASEWYRKRQKGEVMLETVIDAPSATQGAFMKSDMPVSFAQAYRKYEYRSIVTNPRDVIVENPNAKLSHDPMGAF